MATFHWLHILSSSCLLSRCVFRPAFGWSADQHLGARHILIYLITTLTQTVCQLLNQQSDDSQQSLVNLAPVVQIVSNYQHLQGLGFFSLPI